MTTLTNRVAVVTGAGGLLGRRHCAALARQGASVVAGDLDVAAAAEAIDLPGNHLAAELDVTDPEMVGRLASMVKTRHGRVDVLVNNAALNDMVERKSAESPVTPFESFPLDAWRRELEVALTGMFLVSQVVGPLMGEGGSVINIASTYGMVAPDQRLYRDPEGRQTMFKSPAYPAAKGAVIAFTRYLAAYWGERGIRVNALSPGGVLNGQPEHFVEAYSMRTPLGRMARPDEYEGALVFLASDASGYMTGANLVVDGGWTAW